MRKTNDVSEMIERSLELRGRKTFKHAAPNNHSHPLRRLRRKCPHCSENVQPVDLALEYRVSQPLLTTKCLLDAIISTTLQPQMAAQPAGISISY